MFKHVTKKCYWVKVLNCLFSPSLSIPYYPTFFFLFFPPLNIFFHFYLAFPSFRSLPLLFLVQVPLYRLHYTGSTIQVTLYRFHYTGSIQVPFNRVHYIYRFHYTGSNIQVPLYRFHYTGSIIQVPVYSSH